MRNNVSLYVKSYAPFTYTRLGKLRQRWLKFQFRIQGRTLPVIEIKRLEKEPFGGNPGGAGW